MAYLHVMAIGGLLHCLAWLALRRRGIWGGLMLAASLYWAIAFVVRPLLLLWAKPDPQQNDFIADPRLVVSGYAESLGDVLAPVTLGLTVFVALATLVTRRLPKVESRRTFQAIPVWLLFVAGWGFRYTFQLYPENGLLATLALIPSVAVGALFLFCRRPPGASILMVATVSESLWSLVTLSKTPLMALGLWAFLGLYQSPGRVKVARTFLLAAAVLLAFVAVQGLKIGDGRLTPTEGINIQAGPLADTISRPVLTVVQRFDLLSATADAYYAGPGSWLTPREAFLRGGQSVIPDQLVDEGRNVGFLWGRDVRTRSRPGSTPSAHLAEGAVAEGYVVGGLIGVVVEMALLLVIFLVVSLCFRARSVMLRFFALTMSASPYLFERGILGISEGLGKGLQVATVATLALWFVEVTAPSSRAKGGKPVPRASAMPPTSQPATWSLKGSGNTGPEIG